MVGSDHPDSIFKVPPGTVAGQRLPSVSISPPVASNRASAMAFALQAMRDHSPFRMDFSGRLFELAEEIENYLAYGITPKRQTSAAPDLFGPGDEGGGQQ